jgi:preprotein translocase subunit SecG
MSVSKNLTNEVKGIALMVVIIVVMSVVLLQFKTKNIGDAFCSGAHPIYNASTDNCINATGAYQEAVALSGLGGTVNNTVTALGTPITWIAIVIIVIVIAWVLKYFQGKNKKF